MAPLLGTQASPYICAFYSKHHREQNSKTSLEISASRSHVKKNSCSSDPDTFSRDYKAQYLEHSTCPLKIYVSRSFVTILIPLRGYVVEDVVTFYSEPGGGLNNAWKVSQRALYSDNCFRRASKNRLPFTLIPDVPICSVVRNRR